MTPEEIIDHPGKEILCIAAAGSGKTYVLTHRIAHLVRDKRVDASTILALTFTRRAAREMRERIAAIVGQQVADRMRIGTFHAVCLELLGLRGECVGVTNDTQIITPDDSALILRHVAQSMRLYATRWKSGWSFKRAQQAVEAFYRESPQKTEQDAALATTYVNFCLDHFCLDFGLMLRLVRMMFDRFPDTLKAEQQRTRHVFVDEMQDTDTSQYSVHEYYIRDCDSFFGVGDPRQTIYTWRDARPDLMSATHPGATVVPLSGCRRCSEPIITFANSVLEPIRAKLGVEDVHTLRADGVNYPVAMMKSQLDTAAWERNLCRLKQQYDCEWRDMAILARKHDTLAQIAERIGPNVPFRYVGRDERTTFQDDSWLSTYAQLRGVVNPSDALAALSCAPPLSGDADEKVCTVLAEDESDGARWWKRQYGFVTVREALRWHALYDSQDDMDDTDAVTLLTIHSAKGLEWRVVIVAAVNEGEIPSKLALREDPEGEEERRLLYVAATRAKDVLLILYDPTCPSRFILERQA